MESKPTTLKDARKEVESHSSQLTNQRVGIIKSNLWQIGLDVMSGKPHPVARLQFFACALEYYLEVKDAIYDTEDIDKIEKQIIEGNKISARWRATGKATGAEMENILQISLSLQSMLNTSLQKLRYFFRMGKHDPKGIDQALKIFGPDIWVEHGNNKKN